MPLRNTTTLIDSHRFPLQKGILVILLTWAFTTLANTESQLSKQLLVVTENSPPFNYLDKQGNISGSSTVLIKKVLKQAGISYRMEMFPWVRAYQLALERPNVLIYTIARHPQRESLFQWICPINHSEPVYLYKLRESTHLNAQSLEQLKKYRLGITKRGLSNQFLREHGFTSHQQLDESVQEETNIKKLIKGRVDYLPMTPSSLTEHLKTLHIDNNRIERTFMLMTDDAYDKCMAFSKQTPLATVTRVKEAFNKLVAREQR